MIAYILDTAQPSTRPPTISVMGGEPSAIMNDWGGNWLVWMTVRWVGLK